MPEKSLIVCEKPSVAEAIAATVGARQKRNGFYEGENYLVTWAFGHLIELADAADYDSRYRRWTYKSLPIIPDTFKLKLKPDRKARAQFEVIRALAERPEIGQFINACDAGREGELIFRYLYRLIGNNKPIRRLWLSSVVREAIRKAMTRLADGTAYDSLAAAAEARSESDWLVGINATRAYTVKCKTLLQLGRVLTPTLAMIVHREDEIAAFLPEDFWEITAQFATTETSYNGLWTDAKGSRLFSLSAAADILAKVRDQEGTVRLVEVKETQRHAPLLYNLTDLQKDANRRFRFTAQKTMQIAQKLYEEKKLITYPRTDSNYLTREVYGELHEILASLNCPPYAAYVSPLLAKQIPYLPRMINDRKVGDHHAIIPTTVSFTQRSLTETERLIYDLIVRRLVAGFFPPAVYREQESVTEVAGERFVTKETCLLSPGWLTVTGKEEQAVEVQPAVSLSVGDKALVKGTELKKGTTAPPPRYTEGTLLAAMETAGKLVDDEELKEALKEKGIGTVATRPQIIEKLKTADYVTLEELALRPTTKGTALIHALPTASLTSPELTGEWEKALRDIEKGKGKKDDFLAKVKDYTWQIVDEAIAAPPPELTPTAAPTVGICPLCGGKIIENRKAYTCANRKAGCQLTIWKEIAGKKLTIKQVETLLKKGTTARLRGFKSKSGKSFAARLALEEGKVVFHF